MQFTSILTTFLVTLFFMLTLTSSAPLPDPEADPEAEASMSPKPGLTKRGFTGHATYYTPGLGACGWVHKSTDSIAAVAIGRGKGECGRRVRITRGNKSCIVTIVDLCAGCKYGDIDLSPTAFKKIGKISEGRVNVNWRYA